jgi:hypothetical protein
VTVSLVQQNGSINSASTSLSSNVTAGNSVMLLVSCYSTTNGATLTSSAPTFNGSAVSGAVKVCSAQSGYSSFSIYGAVWLLPDLAGGASSLGITFGGTGATASLCWGQEVAGLGASPTAQTPATAQGSSSSGTAISSGTTPTITGAAFVSGLGAATGETFTSGNVPTSPWTSLVEDSGFLALSYQIASSGTATWSVTGSTSAEWAAMAAVVYATSGGTPHTDTASLTVTPSFTATAAHGHFATAALTVTPSFATTRVHGHNPTTALTVTPVFGTARVQGHVRAGNHLGIVPGFHAVASGGVPPIPGGSGLNTGGGSNNHGRGWLKRRILWG